jgi:preprotein translocase subunit SecB
MDAFADRFAVFNAWPYMRETIQSITQRMGFNPPPLPLLRLVPPNIKASPQKTKGYPRSPGLMEG